MSDAPALLAAIRAAPDDDAPRLVYADWLEEHGQPDRAEFIRVQCELARRDDPVLRQRETELLAAHHDAFAAALAAPGLRFRFERGFVIGFGHTGVFLDAGKWGGGIFMRFFPNGSWVQGIGFTLSDPAHRLKLSQLLGHPDLDCGFYTLCGLNYPAPLTLAAPHHGEARVSCRGVLKGADLELTFHSAAPGDSAARTYQFCHSHGDFDSFAET